MLVPETYLPLSNTDGRHRSVEEAIDGRGALIRGARPRLSLAIDRGAPGAGADRGSARCGKTTCLDSPRKLESAGAVEVLALEEDLGSGERVHRQHLPQLFLVRWHVVTAIYAKIRVPQVTRGGAVW